MSTTPPRPARGRPASRARSSAPAPERSRGGRATAVADRERPRARAVRGPARAGTGTGLDRLRILLAATMGAVLAGYTLLVPVAALLTGTGGVPVTADGALATAVPLWLAAHRIPIALDGRPLGVLPLLPTLVVVTLVAFASRWAVRRLGGRVRHDAGAVVASQAGAAAAVAVLAGALLPKDMAVTAPWASMLGAGLVAGAAAGVGVVHACGAPAAWKRVLAGWPGASLAGARVAAVALVLVSALLLVVALLASASEVAEIARRLAPGAWAGVGVLVLGVGYLPNALVGALSWSLGAGVSVGIARSGPLGAEPGPLPPFPLAAVLPVTSVPAVAALVLLLPVAAGVLGGLACRRALPGDAAVGERVAAPAVAAVVVAVGAAVAAGLAGGRLAGGPYDPVSLHAWPVLFAALLLVGIPAVLTCAGPELARHVPVGGPDRDRPRSTADRARAARERRRPSTVADLVEHRRTGGAPGRAPSRAAAGRDTGVGDDRDTGDGDDRDGAPADRGDRDRGDRDRDDRGHDDRGGDTGGDPGGDPGGRTDRITRRPPPGQDDPGR
ncbi:DUF6350 family protein [Pseudonocardia spirodelae]|uniref:DUF6350 family protein n=1 Tax=Pseudonocardia spirodelae TaxID=3133431 RepID=A0ABU8T8P5_9PSEU